MKQIIVLLLFAGGVVSCAQPASSSVDVDGIPIAMPASDGTNIEELASELHLTPQAAPAPDPGGDKCKGVTSCVLTRECLDCLKANCPGISKENPIPCSQAPTGGPITCKCPDVPVS